MNAPHLRCEGCGEEVALNEVESGDGHAREQCCRACGGSGVAGVVDWSMAMAGGDPSLEGMTVSCGSCGGAGRTLELCGPVSSPTDFDACHRCGERVYIPHRDEHECPEGP